MVSLVALTLLSQGLARTGSKPVLIVPDRARPETRVTVGSQGDISGINDIDVRPLSDYFSGTEPSFRTARMLSKSEVEFSRAAAGTYVIYSASKAAVPAFIFVRPGMNQSPGTVPGRLIGGHDPVLRSFGYAFTISQPLDTVNFEYLAVITKDGEPTNNAVRPLPQEFRNDSTNGTQPVSQNGTVYEFLVRRGFDPNYKPDLMILLYRRPKNSTVAWTYISHSDPRTLTESNVVASQTNTD